MTQHFPVAIASGVVRPAALTVGELADAYMANYSGGDQSLGARVRWFTGQLGDRAAQSIIRDDLLDCLETLARTLGRNGKPLSAGTVNRHASTIGGIFRWADQRRLMPRGWTSPTKGLGRRPESQGRVRFLSDAERSRLFPACKVAKWKPLYPFVLLAITTGARKSELLGLTWGRVNFEDATAYVPTSKNEDPRVLVLVPQAIEALKKVKPARATGEMLVFPSLQSSVLLLVPREAVALAKHGGEERSRDQTMPLE